MVGLQPWQPLPLRGPCTVGRNGTLQAWFTSKFLLLEFLFCINYSEDRCVTSSLFKYCIAKTRLFLFNKEVIIWHLFFKYCLTFTAFTSDKREIVRWLVIIHVSHPTERGLNPVKFACGMTFIDLNWNQGLSPSFHVFPPSIFGSSQSH